MTAAEAAGSLLLQQRLRSLKLDVVRLRYEDFAISFDSMENFCRGTRMTREQLAENSDLRDGCTIVRHSADGNIYIVLYNERVTNAGRRAFTLAHEVGHIYLRHESDCPENEREANAFAAELLMPRVILHEYFRRSGSRLAPRELCEVFGVSMEMASNALTRLGGARGEPEFSQLELELLSRFGGLLPDRDGPVVDF